MEILFVAVGACVAYIVLKDLLSLVTRRDEIDLSPYLREQDATSCCLGLDGHAARVVAADDFRDVVSCVCGWRSVASTWNGGWREFDQHEWAAWVESGGNTRDET